MDGKMNRREALKRIGIATMGLAVGSYETTFSQEVCNNKESTISVEEMDNLQFTRDWAKNFLDNIQTDCEQAADHKIDIKKTLMRCSAICFAKNGFEEKIKSCGSFDKFIDFCEKELGWIVNYNRSEKVLVCDENKSECLCPIVKTCKGKVSAYMCCCTEGELKRIFETAYGGKVKTEVLSSILRGDKRCVYRITLL